MTTTENNLFAFKLLGKPHITLGGQTVSGFISAKAQGLLIYLAVTGKAHTRSALANLFWDDMPDAQAAKNLRNALSNLRALAGPHILITRDEVALDASLPFSLDVDDFTHAITNDANTLQRAVELYQGDFLAGFYVKNALGFEEWALGRQATLKNMALQALHTLVTRHLEREEYAAGINYANRLLAIGPWHEETHRNLMKLLSRSGQRSAALAQYQICRQTLKTELGVEPLAETVALHERIKAAAAPPPHNLPPQPTPFVGRAAEMAELTRFLRHPAAQLLTLTGPGGIGKTRLALQGAARAIDPSQNDEQIFGDGVFFAPLVHMADGLSGESLMTALAEALRIEIQGPMQPQAQVLAFLRDKKMLLILDNFEHLANDAGQLAQLLRLAPGVKAVVTSRVRLNLPEETLLEVKGLDFPASGQPTDPEKFGALRLFIQNARRIRADFALDAGEMAAAIRICQLVEGAPLGIELAASWLRALACAEIAREIQASLDFLTASSPHVSQRHRSLRAVFDYSWGLLRPDEKSVLGRLAVFRGGFEREAALKIAGASITMLAGLVDHSLLWRSSTGRYQIHEVVRQFAEETLRGQTEDDERTRNAHARYFAQWLLARQSALKSADTATSLVIETERENIRAAWNWAISHRLAAEVDMFMACL
jgi:DNA-binding SARP family transcriptional activator/predicted ATPase